ncbi:MAG: TetR/AcrR family transcriptional regulator, partial [Bacteroidota bacterium]
MDDIARELGMSKKTLYQYVNNKADLINQIFEQHIFEEQCIMDQYKEESKDAVDEILKIARYVIRQVRKYSPTILYDLQKYYREIWKQMDAHDSKRIMKIIRENMERGMEEGLYRLDMSPDIISRLYTAKSSMVSNADIFPIQEYPMEQLFKEHIYYHIRGIASPILLER